MPNSSPTPLARLLRTATSSLWAEAQRRLRLTRVLHQHLPPASHAHCQVLNLTAHTLVLAADSPAWVARLRYSTPQILQHFTQYEAVNLRTIRIRVLPTAAAPPPKAAPSRPALSSHNGELLRQAADAIDHPQLEKALRQLATRSEG